MPLCLRLPTLTVLLALQAACGRAVDPKLATEGLFVDLDARHGVARSGEHVLAWTNQVPGVARVFVATRETGRPIFKEAAVSGRPALVFDKKELINAEEDAFDRLIQGSGYTWAVVLAPLRQRPGLKDVNSFFGNLRNGGQYEGFWGCLNDDNSVWMGSRNGRTFGRFNVDNPKVQGPRLKEGEYVVLAGRMGAGTGTVPVELFVNSHRPAASDTLAINPAANPSKMAIGQERDAIEHPGHESFVGEIARVLFWERPLTDEELQAAIGLLRRDYLGAPAVSR